MSRLSPSEYKTLFTCPRLWWFRYVHELPEPETEAMLRGREVHEALAEYYRTGKTDDDLILAYSRHDPFKDHEILAVEERIGDGIADLIVRDAEGVVWIVDHKTGSPPPEWDIQLLYYADEYKKRHRKAVVGIAVNCIKPVYPQPPRELKSGKLSMDKRQPLVRHLCPEGEEWDWVLEKEKEYFSQSYYIPTREDFLLMRRELRLARRVRSYYKKMTVPPRAHGWKCRHCAFAEVCSNPPHTLVLVVMARKEELRHEEGEHCDCDF